MIFFHHWYQRMRWLHITFLVIGLVGLVVAPLAGIPAYLGIQDTHAAIAEWRANGQKSSPPDWMGVGRLFMYIVTGISIFMGTAGIFLTSSSIFALLARKRRVQMTGPPPMPPEGGGRKVS